MIKNMKSNRTFNVTFRFFQKVIIERNDFIASSAYKMMVVMFRSAVQQMSDLVTHTSLIQINLVYELHIP